jgi:hypothetical protein
MPASIVSSNKGSITKSSQAPKLAHGILQSIQHLFGICQRHCGVEAVMAGGAAVIVKIDAVPSRGGDESQHRFALVAHGLAVTADWLRRAEIDVESRSQSLHAGGDAVTGEKGVQPCVQTLGDGVDVIGQRKGRRELTIGAVQ